MSVSEFFPPPYENVCSRAKCSVTLAGSAPRVYKSSFSRLRGTLRGTAGGDAGICSGVNVDRWSVNTEGSHTYPRNATPSARERRGRRMGDEIRWNGQLVLSFSRKIRLKGKLILCMRLHITPYYPMYLSVTNSALLTKSPRTTRRRKQLCKIATVRASWQLALMISLKFACYCGYF